MSRRRRNAQPTRDERIGVGILLLLIAPMLVFIAVVVLKQFWWVLLVIALFGWVNSR